MFTLLFGGGILTWIWVTDAIGDTSANLIGQLYPVYLAEIGGLNVEQVGWLNALLGAASIVASPLAGWLTDRQGERAVIVGGFALEMMGLVTLVQAGALPGFMAAMAAFGLGMGCLIPAYDSLVSKVVPEDQRGLAFGLFGTSLGLLSLPFPWIGAQLWERVSPQTPFWVTITASLISIPIAWLTFALPREEMEPTSPREGEVGESASPTIAES